jgi:hypothetical protein
VDVRESRSNRCLLNAPGRSALKKSCRPVFE